MSSSHEQEQEPHDPTSLLSSLKITSPSKPALTSYPFPHPTPPSEPLSAGYTSDQSWTLDDELTPFYTDINTQLTTFASDPELDTFTTPHLSKPQRKYVHATAKVLGLEHISLGPVREYRKVQVKKFAGKGWEDFMVRTGTGLVATSAPVGRREWGFMSGWGEGAGLVRSLSARTVVPWEEEEEEDEREGRGKKRKRFPRREGGFCCSFEGCVRVFDRASERKKHEQVHAPDGGRRHSCARCGRGFRYPKDLRRHLKGVHGEEGGEEGDGASNRVDSAKSWIIGDDDGDVEKREENFGKFDLPAFDLGTPLPLFGGEASWSMGGDSPSDKVYQYLSGMHPDGR